MLLFELLYLLQGEERSASSFDGLLRVSDRPVFECLRMATLHMETQVLPVLSHKVTHVTGERFLSCRKHKHIQNSFNRYYRRYSINMINVKESLSATLTCVFDGQMWDQELLFRSGVFTVVTLEGPVVGVGQLMVEEQLFVVTGEITELTLEPGTWTQQRDSLWWGHHY